MSDDPGAGPGLPPPPPPAPSLPPGAATAPGAHQAPGSYQPGSGAPGWPPVGGPTGGGWAPPTERPRRSRKPWVIGCLGLLLLLVIGVGACSVLAFRSFGSAGAILAASNGEIDGFNIRTFNGSTTIWLQAARGVDDSEGERLACEVIRPAIAATELAGTPWVLVNRAGDPIASNETPCP
jgi:hypothetical protein